MIKYSTKFVLEALISHLNIDVFLDIGSRDAKEALELKRSIPSANFICFEANHKNYASILENEEILKSGIKVENLAISNSNGMIEFFEYNTPGTGSLKVREHLEPSNRLLVRSTKLDDYFKDSKTKGNIAMWLDVEGAAYDVFLGAVDTLKNVKIIYTEVESKKVYKYQRNRNDIINFLRQHGFQEVAYTSHSKMGLSESVGDSLFLKENLLGKSEIITIINKAKRRSSYNKLKIILYEYFERNLSLGVKIWKLLKGV